MSILSGEEPLIDRLMRAYNRMSTPPPGVQAATGGGPLTGVPVPMTSASPIGVGVDPTVQLAAPRVGIPSISQTPPIAPTAGPSPRIDDTVIPPPVTPAPMMDRPVIDPSQIPISSYDYAGNGKPFTDPVTVGPDPREDLQSEAGQAWLAKVNPKITNTPAGPAMSTISTLHGSLPGLDAFYSAQQMNDQQARGINLVGGNPFRWDTGNAAQLNAALGTRAVAESQARYLREKGRADIEMARAAEEGKLARYDPTRMQTMVLLKAAELNPGLWTQPEFKQKVGVPLTPADKMTLLQGQHPGLDIAGGLEQIGSGYAPGTSRLTQMFDTSRFGMPALTPREKVEQALSLIPPNNADEWRRVAEVMGLLNPVTGAPSR